MPMMRIERMTSPLPRECSTTEPHGQGSGAGEGNRTLVGGLEGPSSTIELHPLKFEDYIIPPRGNFPAELLQQYRWWRGMDSNHRRRKPTDLQSAPFSHSGTPPSRENEIITERQ